MIIAVSPDNGDSYVGRKPDLLTFKDSSRSSSKIGIVTIDTLQITFGVSRHASQSLHVAPVRM